MLLHERARVDIVTKAKHSANEQDFSTPETTKPAQGGLSFVGFGLGSVETEGQLKLVDVLQQFLPRAEPFAMLAQTSKPRV